MTLDELIAALQEAKEHGIQGGRKVILVDSYSGDESYPLKVLYDNKNVKISF